MHTLEELTPQMPQKAGPTPADVQPRQTLLKHVIDILDGVPAARPASEGKTPRGQSLIEMAFIIPVLIVLVAGIVEIGWYANNYINLLEAAKVGARRGPFLNDDNSPLLFNTDSSYAPRVAAANGAYPKLASPLDAGFDADDPRNRLRGFTSPTSPRCDGITNIQDYGFYNLILCTVLESLDPLSMRISNDYNDEADDNRPKDDIVISVFSIQRVSNGNPNAINPATATSEEPRRFDFDINARSNLDYPPGDQVIVVGRWPYNANECVNGANNQEGRDPFDYIVNNGTVDFDPIVTATGKVIRLPYELAVEVNDPDTGAFLSFQGWADAGNENQRGWAYTGQHIIDPVAGYGANCYGSEFSLPEVEALVNLPEFIQNAPTPDDEARRRGHLPSQGLVLVEVFWEHTLLLGTARMRLYEAYDLFSGWMPGGADRVIHVWAAFPAPAAEPNIVYKLSED